MCSLIEPSNSLGLACVSKNVYYDIIKLVYPHLKDILDEMRNKEKERMKSILDEDLEA